MKNTIASTLCRGILITIGATALITSAGCRAVGGAEGDSPAMQRASIKSESATTLDKLYATRPQTRDKVKNAAGYAYFSNVNVHVLLLSTENGYGMVHNNATGKDTYMKMAGAGAGLGLRAKDYRTVFIFTDPSVMHQFVDSGWDFGASADAAAKTGNTGAAANTGITTTAVAGMEIYQFTKDGLALQATVQGTKYWQDKALNN